MKIKQWLWLQMAYYIMNTPCHNSHFGPFNFALILNSFKDQNDLPKKSFHIYTTIVV
jgi:hypothetical protein